MVESQKLISPSALEIFEEFLKNYQSVNPNGSLKEILKRRLPKIFFEQTKQLIDQVDEILSLKIESEYLTLEALHTLTYCGAQTVIKLCGINGIPTYSQDRIPKVFPEDEEAQKELFKVSPHRFRHLLFAKPPASEASKSKTPSVEEIEKFWSHLWEKETYYNKDQALGYLQNEEARIGDISMEYERITMNDLKKALKKKKNWSPPGIDGVQTFWYKKFKSVKIYLLRKINQIIDGKEAIPEFFTVGFTELFPKSKETEKVANYRPITHLPAIYKIITRCIYQKIFDHYEKNKILAVEQSGGRKGCFGVRKTLVMDSIALEQESVWGYYVDFRKAFDMVSHQWVLKLLRVYKVEEKLVSCLEKMMSNWKTRLSMESGVLTRSISFKRGVFQGDSNSVLLYWTAINPLSFAINRSDLGLKLAQGGHISHLLYMDDLKLYSSKEENLQEIYTIVEQFAGATSMEINKKKTRLFSLPKEQHLKEEDLKPDVYLGYTQTPKIAHEKIVYHKVRRFEEKLKKLKETKISDPDKSIFKKTFLTNSIFNSFGVLEWKCFKRELLELELNGKKLKRVDDSASFLKNVHLRFFYVVDKMRKTFFAEKEMEDVVKNDTFTPLQLSESDDAAYFRWLVARFETGLRGQKREKKQKQKKNKRKSKEENNYINCND